jgi:hypothetical protein
LPDRHLLLNDPGLIVAGTGAAHGVVARRVTEGLLLSGRWQFASGCEDADYANLIVPAGRLQTGERFVASPAPQTGGVAAMLAPLVGATRGAWQDIRDMLAPLADRARLRTRLTASAQSCRQAVESCSTSAV